MHNSSDYDYWVNTFARKTDDWKRKRLKQLKEQPQTFATPTETEHKIKALEFLLNK